MAPRDRLHVHADIAALFDRVPHGNRVDATTPGVIDTPMWQHVDALFVKQRGLQVGEKTVPLGTAVRPGCRGRPGDIAGPAALLAGDGAGNAAAQCLNVDVGSVMS